MEVNSYCGATDWVVFGFSLAFGLFLGVDLVGGLGFVSLLQFHDYLIESILLVIRGA